VTRNRQPCGNLGSVARAVGDSRAQGALKTVRL